jgi:hypothetical protein
MASICQYEAISAAELDSRALNGRSIRRPHVLTLTPFYPMGSDDAAGCFVAESLRGVADIGVKNTVIAVRPFYRSGQATATRTAPPATWIRYKALPGMAGLAMSGRALFLNIRSAARRLHAEEPLSLIHAHAGLPCGHAAALLARDLSIPFVVTVHGRDVFSSRNGGLIGHWCERVSKRVYGSAARVICISGKVEEDLRSRVQCRSVVVHNGVNAELFCPPVAESGTEAVVLSIGNLIPTKGHETLLRAVAEASGSYPLLRCQIIGVGPEQRRLSRIARELRISDRVQFPGRQSRTSVARAMQRCSVFALPSTYEGLGCVYLEAMATGRPTIACTGQGIGEVIQSGKNGWLVQPDDVQELAKTLRLFLSDSALRDRVGLAARRTVVENFTLKHQAERLAQVYQECAE